MWWYSRIAWISSYSSAICPSQGGGGRRAGSCPVNEEGEPIPLDGVPATAGVGVAVGAADATVAATASAGVISAALARLATRSTATARNRMAGVRDGVTANVLTRSPPGSLEPDDSTCRPGATRMKMHRKVHLDNRHLPGRQRNGPSQIH